jgi:general secretion pathway protein I
MRRRGRCTNAAQSGFTLLEVMVALVIAILALAALFSGIAGGLHAVQRADLTEQALSRARSRLDGLAGTALRSGAQSGDDGGGFVWQTRITQAGSAMTSGVVPRASAKLALYHVSVIVSWRAEGKTRHVQLDSDRLATSSVATP